MKVYVCLRGDVNVIFERIRQQGFFAGAQGGIFISALTAVEYALWDVTGKALNLPIYRLLGGQFRDRIRIYCDTASSSEEPEDMAKAAQEVVDHGFTAIKFDLDWNNDPEVMKNIIAFYRKAKVSINIHIYTYIVHNT